MGKSAQGRVGVLAFAAVIVSVSITGCASTSVPATGGSPSAQPSATPSATAPTVETATLSFGAAEEVVGGDWLVGWADPFPDDPRYIGEFSEESGYVYYDTLSKCDITLSLARLADEPLAEDDRRLSDAMIAGWLVGGSPSEEEIDDVASGDEIQPIAQVDSDATVDFRTWYGETDEGESVMLAARAFGEMAAGMLVTVECPRGPSAAPVFDRIVEEDVRVSAQAPTDTASPAPDETSADDEARTDQPPAGLTFDEGARLDAARWGLEWADALHSDPDFRLSTPDDGNGNWAYTDVRNGCTAAFFQGTMGDLDMTRGDREITDQYLVIILSAMGVDEAEAPEWIESDQVGRDHADLVDVRIVGATLGAGETWAHVARMVGPLGGGVTVDIRCPAGEQEAWDEYDELFDGRLWIAVTSRGV